MNHEDMVIEQMLISLRRIIRSVDLHSQHLVKLCGLTGPQLVLLKEIQKSEEVTPGELARAMNLSNATVTGIVSRLESRGMILRRRSNEDRRRVLLELREPGVRALEAAPEPLQERLANGVRELREWEQTQLLSALQRVAEILQAENLDAAPILASGPLTLSEEHIRTDDPQPSALAAGDREEEPASDGTD